MLKFVCLIFLLVNINLALGAGLTTTYSLCKRVLEGKSQSIVVAMETLSESKCRLQGKRKADLYATAGWKCSGFKGEESYSCENKKSSTYAIFNGKKADNLTFTNLQKHRSIVVYLNPNSNKICHEDQDELVSAGVSDAICHRP